MSKITPELVAQFNEMMQDHESIIRIYKAEGNDYAYDIRPMKDVYIQDSSLVYPTKTFYNILNDFFTICNGIKLTYNNTGTTFWNDFE